MPYLGIGEFILPAVKERLREQGVQNPPNYLVSQLTAKFDNRKIGEGCESVVIDIGGAPRKVVAIGRWGRYSIEMKQSYYLHAIFAALFPHNFPRLLAAFGYHQGETYGLAGTVRAKIESRPLWRSLLDAMMKSPVPHNPKHPFQDVLDAVAHYRLPIFIDRNKKNFIIGRDGGEYYVDIIGLSRPNPQWDLKNTYRLLDINTATTPVEQRVNARQTVTSSLNRLSALGLIELKPKIR